MTHSTDIETLARWMAADFSNQEQAIENPPFFAHIRVCMRPLPWELLDGLSLYLEQAYDYMLGQPYRVRVLKLIPTGDRIQIENYKIDEQEQFFGAAREVERLQELTRERLEKIPGSTFIAEWTGEGFKGAIEPGKKCIVVRKGKTTYLDSQFEITPEVFISHDRGRDPETDEHVWGSVAGPFVFTKRLADFGDEVILKG
ncbi:chromophore lyase CpcT/CpeT [Oxynema sp. CENA135]|uniref:chromophore lyase CpcT/CpeT n=1 Tax=Oxynema sp. CENA135 TaxID=984206 RepID=UPI00190D8D84|nr:chromophore lyase CpcT/CpeT [Oxynema sp. CENA135]MBK4731149.1 chromophore lyase CpcT/CpeT [Oxynema sp. CENA135]